MNKMEFDKMYVGKKLAVWCRTEGLAERFLKLAHGFGYEWGSGRRYSDSNNWEEYKRITCYHIYGGEYDSKYYFEEENFTIVEFRDEQQVKSKFQKGDVVTVIDNGKGYTMYSDILGKAYKDGLIDSIDVVMFDYNVSISNGSEVKVLATIKHENYDIMLVIVKYDNKTYVISEDGLEKYFKVVVNGTDYMVDTKKLKKLVEIVQK